MPPTIVLIRHAQALHNEAHNCRLFTGPLHPRPPPDRPRHPAMRPAALQPRPALLLVPGPRRRHCEPDAADAADGEFGGRLAG
ncbi:hypothetical protein TARUN_10312 [Trichoderma arundinaceum]|uniref:Phosphoglycerate mutase n=1 Tax=Trichoderma arundinaceum TaxID=490622 RepID=A0A395N759_TRIAR|nr:hypothetical protein TARUN_10312 [Trichoderma arundinaceum]